MRVPYSWLMEFLQTDLGPEDLARELTMGGLEVEEIRDWTSEDGQATDKILVTKVTANRGDMLSILGVARQAAACLGTSYALPDFSQECIAQPVSGHLRAEADGITVELQDPQGCPRYSALLLEGVKLGPSPAWLAHRLEAAGMRPLVNVVDCTNYVMLELGQPLHAFDFALLKDGHVIVRRAAEGEKLLSLDRQWRHLVAEDLLIADPAGGAALAGVMGGADTEVNDRSVKILLESAHFDPTAIRKTSMRLGLSSEASYRFERHVDPNGTLRALARVSGLILETAGGKIASPAIDARAEDFAPRRIILRPERCNHILGTAFTAEHMADSLRALDMGVTESAEGLQVDVPRLRWDIEREIDLIEEVAIVTGYNNIPMSVPGRLAQSGLLTLRQKQVRRVGEILRECGLNESLSFSVSCPAELDRLGLAADAPERAMLPLSNPMIDTQSHMRTTLMPALLEACATNVRQRVTEVALYEVNKVFLPVPGRDLPDEPLRAAGVLLGLPLTAAWNLPAESTTPDFFLLKGIVEELCAGLGLSDVAFTRATHPTFHPGRCATLLIEGQPAGLLGEVAASVQEAYDLPTPAYLFELDLETLLASACAYKPYRALPRFPAVLRDLAFVMPNDDAHSTATIKALILGAGGEILCGVQAFDLYIDDQRLGAGLKSLAFRLEFRSDDRTLVDAEVDDVMATINQAVQGQTQAQARDY